MMTVFLLGCDISVEALLLWSDGMRNEDVRCVFEAVKCIPLTRTHKSTRANLSFIFIFKLHLIQMAPRSNAN